MTVNLYMHHDPDGSPLATELKRYYDQGVYRDTHGPGPWRCGAGDDCLMVVWARQHGLVGKVQSGIVEADPTGIVHEGQCWHAECLVAAADSPPIPASMVEAAHQHLVECPGCLQYKPKGAMSQHQKACR